MPIDITVEDGSIVEDANSYINVDDVREFAANRGVALPESDDDVAILILKAMDYLEGFRDQFQGTRTEGREQALQWPRADVQIDGFDVDDDEIPVELRNCVAQLCMEQYANGLNLTPTVGAFVTEEKVGPITVKYSEMVRTMGLPVIASIQAWLDALTGLSATIKTIRV